MGWTYADAMAAGDSTLGVPVWIGPSVSSSYNGDFRLLPPPFAGGLEQSSQRLEGQGVQQEETASQAITIYLSSGHKRAVMALLAAVNQGTTRTGLADFDALSAAHGLIGIHRKRSRSFRLMFAPGVDVATVAGAYIYATDLKPPTMVRAQEAGDQAGERRDSGGIGKRLVKKLVVGGLGGVGGAYFGAGLMLALDSHQNTEGDDGIGRAMAGVVGLWGGYIGGTAMGVSGVDPHDNFRMTLAASALVGVGVPVIMSALVNNEEGLVLSALFSPVIGATIASELWRNPPGRVSVGLLPALKGGLSASATLHF